MAKIEIARDIIERNLVDWNQSTRLGLVAAPAAQAAVDPAATEAATPRPRRDPERGARPSRAGE